MYTLHAHGWTHCATLRALVCLAYKRRQEELSLLSCVLRLLICATVLCCLLRTGHARASVLPRGDSEHHSLAERISTTASEDPATSAVYDEGRLCHGPAAHQLLFSPDESVVVSLANGARLWSVSDGKLLKRNECQGKCRAATFLDDQELACWSDRGISPKSQRATACIEVRDIIDDALVREISIEVPNSSRLHHDSPLVLSADSTRTRLITCYACDTPDGIVVTAAICSRLGEPHAQLRKTGFSLEGLRAAFWARINLLAMWDHKRVVTWKLGPGNSLQELPPFFSNDRDIRGVVPFEGILTGHERCIVVFFGAASANDRGGDTTFQLVSLERGASIPLADSPLRPTISSVLPHLSFASSRESQERPCTQLLGIYKNGTINALSIVDCTTGLTSVAANLNQDRSPDAVLRQFAHVRSKEGRGVTMPFVSALAWSASARYAAIAFNEDPQILLYDLGQGRRIKAQGGPITRIATSNDGMTCIGLQGTRIVGQIAKRERPFVLAGGGELLRSVAVSSDGRFCATGGESGTVNVWDLHDRSSELESSCGSASILQLAFGSANRTLVTADSNGLATKWTAPGNKWHDVSRTYISQRDMRLVDKIDINARLPSEDVVLHRAGGGNNWNPNCCQIAVDGSRIAYFISTPLTRAGDISRYFIRYPQVDERWYSWNFLPLLMGGEKGVFEIRDSESETITVVNRENIISDKEGNAYLTQYRLSDNGRFIAMLINDTQLEIHSIAEKRRLNRISLSSKPVDFRFIENGQVFAAVYSGGEITIHTNLLREKLYESTIPDCNPLCMSALRSGAYVFVFIGTSDRGIIRKKVSLSIAGE